MIAKLTNIIYNIEWFSKITHLADNSSRFYTCDEF